MAKDGVRDRVRSARKRVVAAAAKAGDAEDDNVPSGRDGKDMVRESVRSATMAPPVKNSLETMDGRSRVVEMAKSGMAHPEPDWQDNPDDLDSPQEVRMSLLSAGLNPVDADTKQEALGAHAAVHDFASDPGRGGRSPEQLEAEHDMAVAAMQSHGAEDSSPLDVIGGQDHGGGNGALVFGDPFGAASGLSFEDTDSDGDSGGGWDWL
jgi:hypothetical protein